MTQSIQRTIIAILALASAALGVYMWADPIGWFEATPGVSNTGSHNHHFIRDVGAMYLTMAGALLLGLRIDRFLQPALAFSTGWLTLHAIVHLWDVAASRLPIEHLVTDLPGVFAPPLIIGYFAWRTQNTTS